MSDARSPGPHGPRDDAPHDVGPTPRVWGRADVVGLVDQAWVNAMSATFMVE